MKRFVILCMSLTLLLAWSVPVAIGAKETAACQKKCEEKVEICKKNCVGDDACIRSCIDKEDGCKLGCN